MDAAGGMRSLEKGDDAEEMQNPELHFLGTV